MSGLEVIGIVASIIQLADLGTKLSVKLCTFYRTVKTTNQSLQGLSSDVSLTCSILNEFGKVLEQDDQAKICSKQAFSTAQEVLVECKAVFQQIETALEKQDQDAETNPFRRGARKISAAFLKPDLDILKGNLERLKTTTLLMLHVIMYAGDLRKRTTNSNLMDQQLLIQSLIEERNAYQRSIEPSNETFQPLMLQRSLNTTQNETPPFLETQQQLDCLPTQLRDYYALIQKLLHDVDAYENCLDQSRHIRMRNGIVTLHSTEVDQFCDIHGHATRQLFDDPFFKLYDPRTRPTIDASSTSQSRAPKVRDGLHDRQTIVIRRKAEAEPDEEVSIHRYKRTVNYYDEYGERQYIARNEIHINPLESDYDIDHRSDAKEDQYQYYNYRPVRRYQSRPNQDSLACPGDYIVHPRHPRNRSRSRSRSSTRFRSRSRSRSRCRSKRLTEVGLAAAAAAGIAALRKNRPNDGRSRSRSRSRSRFRSRGRSPCSIPSEKAGGEEEEEARRRQHHDIAGVGIVVERQRTKFRSPGHAVPHSDLRRSGLGMAAPRVAAGLGSAAAAGLYEKAKAKHEKVDEGYWKRDHSLRSRSRSLPMSNEDHPDSSRRSSGLIEYGADPIFGVIPVENYNSKSTRFAETYDSDVGDLCGSQHHFQNDELEYPKSRLGLTGSIFGNMRYSDNWRNQRGHKRRHEKEELNESIYGYCHSDPGRLSEMSPAEHTPAKRQRPMGTDSIENMDQDVSESSSSSSRSSSLGRLSTSHSVKDVDMGGMPNTENDSIPKMPGINKMLGSAAAVNMLVLEWTTLTQDEISEKREGF